MGVDDMSFRDAPPGPMDRASDRIKRRKNIRRAMARRVECVAWSDVCGFGDMPRRVECVAWSDAGRFIYVPGASNVMRGPTRVGPPHKSNDTDVSTSPNSWP